MTTVSDSHRRWVRAHEKLFIIDGFEQIDRWTNCLTEFIEFRQATSSDYSFDRMMYAYQRFVSKHILDKRILSMVWLCTCLIRTCGWLETRRVHSPTRNILWRIRGQLLYACKTKFDKIQLLQSRTYLTYKNRCRLKTKDVERRRV